MGARGWACGLVVPRQSASLTAIFPSSVEKETISTGLQRSSDTAVLSSPMRELVREHLMYRKKGWPCGAECILARGWTKTFLTEGAGS